MNILDIKITKVDGDSKVIGRASISFEDHLLRGFKIIRDEKSNKEYVTAPSFFNGVKWIPLFKTHNKEDWGKLCSKVIKKYNDELIKESLEESMS